MSTAPSPQKQFTPAEYLALERTADHRSEYFRGRIYAMAGANERHNLIAGNLHAALRSMLRPHGCKAYIADMKVLIPRTGLYTYPDVSVACGDIQFHDDRRDVLLNPCILVEVLSKSTETRDRGWKFQNYWNIDSLVDYVLVSQETAMVEQFIRKSDDIWTFRRYTGLDAALELAAVPCRVPLREIYLDVQLGPEDEDVPPMPASPSL